MTKNIPLGSAGTYTTKYYKNIQNVCSVEHNLQKYMSNN